MITDNSIKDAPFKYDSKVWKIPLFFIFIIWFVYWVEYFFGFNFNEFGIFPRTIQGLRGILFSPFIHGSTNHLISNSLPFFVLTAALIYFYRSISYRVLFIGLLLTGILTWLIASRAYHIGASGLVYLLASFIFFSGIFRKSLRLVAISLAVAFWYGGMIWYILPIVAGMSWEGHLSGFITGLFLAYWYKDIGLKKQEFQFTETEFDQYFDENGNFTPPKDEHENNETVK
jgi:membrane associated rhomboid family serine protease